MVDTQRQLTLLMSLDAIDNTQETMWKYHFSPSQIIWEGQSGTNHTAEELTEIYIDTDDYQLISNNIYFKYITNHTGYSYYGPNTSYNIKILTKSFEYIELNCAKLDDALLFIGHNSSLTIDQSQLNDQITLLIQRYQYYYFDLLIKYECIEYQDGDHYTLCTAITNTKCTFRDFKHLLMQYTKNKSLITARNKLSQWMKRYNLELYTKLVNIHDIDNYDYLSIFPSAHRYSNVKNTKDIRKAMLRNYGLNDYDSDSDLKAPSFID